MRPSCNRRKSKRGDSDRRHGSEVQSTSTARSISQTERMASASLYGLMVVSLKVTSGKENKMRWVASMSRRSTNCMKGSGSKARDMALDC